jgi:hypothetical protein
MDKTPILLGNSFPMSLVRRRVVIEPRTIGELRQVLVERGFRSFWGHENTVVCAEALLGVLVRPKQERPALVLDQERYPALEGEASTECWILSPDYCQGFRPAVGEEVRMSDIIGWQVLRMVWEQPLGKGNL